MNTERSAIVTGGSSGIGLAIARALADKGYGLTLTARDEQKLTGAAATVSAHGVPVHTISVDLAAEPSARAIVAAHRAAFRSLDVLVNCAGVEIERPLEHQAEAEIDHQIAVNLRSALVLTRECIPLLREAGGSAGTALIVNVSSIAGKMGRPGLAVYSATKAALVGLSQSLHHELSGAGIQVTALCPEWVATPMSAHVETIRQEAMIQPGDLARIVSLLLQVGGSCHIPEIQIARRGAPLL